MNKIQMLLLPLSFNPKTNSDWVTLMFQGVPPLTPYAETEFFPPLKESEKRKLGELECEGERLVRRLADLPGVTRIVVKPDQVQVEVMGEKRLKIAFMFAPGGVVQGVFGESLEITIEEATEKVIPIKPAEARENGVCSSQ